MAVLICMENGRGLKEQSLTAGNRSRDVCRKCRRGSEVTLSSSQNSKQSSDWPAHETQS